MDVNRAMLFKSVLFSCKAAMRSRVPGRVFCCVHGGHDSRRQLTIIERFGGGSRANSLDFARGLGGANGCGGGCLFFESCLFEGTEHEGGEMADSFGGAELYLATAELVDGIG